MSKRSLFPLFPLFALLAACLTTASAEEEPWSRLFNGYSLDGWVQRGGTTGVFSIEKNMMMGTPARLGSSAYLCSPRNYGDFILEFEFKSDPQLGPGVVVRAQSSAQPVRFDWRGTLIEIPAYRVHGYEIALDASGERTAAIREQPGRGPLDPGILGSTENEFAKRARAAFKPNDWNTIRVEAMGSSIKTFLNGHECASIQDNRVVNGYIAFHVPSTAANRRNTSARILWRNLRIRDLPPKAVPAPVNTSGGR